MVQHINTIYKEDMCPSFFGGYHTCKGHLCNNLYVVARNFFGDYPDTKKFMKVGFFPYTDWSKILCFMCYCNKDKEKIPMGISRKTTGSRKKSNRKKRSNRRKRSNRSNRRKKSNRRK